MKFIMLSIRVKNDILNDKSVFNFLIDIEFDIIYFFQLMRTDILNRFMCIKKIKNKIS